MTPGATTPPALIKGFLPVRVKILPKNNSSTGSNNNNAKDYDETFFYVKEHRGSAAETTTAKKKGPNNNTTLFVANAPVVPTVRTKLLLQSLLGRFGDISRVTVVDHTNNTTTTTAKDTTASWTTVLGTVPTFLPPDTCQGKFAHVVFASPKDMRRAMRSLTQIMSATAEKDNNNKLPGLVLEPIEIQTLADESDRQYREEQGLVDDDDDDDDDLVHNQQQQKDRHHDHHDEYETSSSSAVIRLAERYRASLRHCSRDALLQECNAVMRQYEAKEEADRQARQAAASVPDDDGFVTVTYAATTRQVGTELLQDEAPQQRRKKGQKRSRKKKKQSGASELSNFYRFQTKEKRKRSLQDLRRKFEDDLEQVKRMKEDKQYRPF